MPAISIVKKAAAYVTSLMEENLPATMYFHNKAHTQRVVNAALEIAGHCKLKKQELTILTIAAWFHDTGYLYHYKGHEDTSMIIAGTFLMQHHYNSDFIQQVWDCIEATKIPQSPKNLIQQIICDADLRHFASENYLDLARDLKQEWEVRLAKHFSDGEWHSLNLAVLQQHQFFTEYGKTVLQAAKQQNIDLMKREG
ncbi:HD domain-containing protein [Mucilaginibacter sp. SMC90]|uniref:HD domain-containing protein n=1 Tax=Mucilaginibacter sp. SMC90 TaxID=2929803 RepID=UPI001FB22067|nr:HD domain-containing protein [Mucilaginibacter sp. SMC90]UOE51251.1 HD domain-containing protein [Mucilaginibacter sp. SMC90]